ncbi:helix-turn-helix domain-containing protein [Rhizobium sp. SYY.PMSO]|uniref:helix-turn-helix domain-containing protein n=1 Tax=Rhizobium sp. SYY.PMSO TaxID=3382192 RepID=UPI00398FA192
MTKRLTETTAQMDCAIGSRIRSIRLLRGMSQMALAERLGITFQQVQKYEKGTNRVAASTLVIISGALQVSPMELLGLEADAGENTAFAELTHRYRDLELRVARARRALGSDDIAPETSVTIGVEIDKAGRMQPLVGSPPN